MNEKSKDTKIWKALVKTLKKPDVIFFYITALIVGIADGIFVNFLYLLLEDMGSSKILMGLNTLIQAGGSVLCFLVASQLIELVGGYDFAIGISVMSFVVRLLLVSLFNDVWLILACAALYMLGFPLYWSAAVKKAYDFSPKHVTFSILGILEVVEVPIAWMITNMVGGMVYDKFGGKWLFRGFSFVCLVWGVIAILKAFLDRNKKSKETQDHGTWLMLELSTV